MKIEDLHTMVDIFQKVSIIEFDGQSEHKYLYEGCYGEIPQELLVKNIDSISTINKTNYLGLFVEINY